MYILNLAISDIIYLAELLLEAWEERRDVTWPLDKNDYALFLFCFRMSLSLTAYSVAVLSIQRYRVTFNPLHVLVSSQPKWLGTVAIICGMWIVDA
jgi:hypothetical protein